MSDPTERLNAALEGRYALHVRSLLLLLLAMMLIGSAHTAEAQTANGQTVESRKSPWGAFGLSVMLPGAGQGYNGQWGKGGLMLGGVAVSFGVVLVDDCDVFYTANNCGFLTAAGLVGVVGFALWSWIDAPLAANAINRGIDAGQVAIEIGPQLIVPQSRSAIAGLRPSGFPSFHGDSRLDLSLVRVRF